MRTWTVQPEIVLEWLHVCRPGSQVICDLSLADIDFQNAYTWMRQKLGDKVQQPFSLITPYWHWVQYESAASPKPDLRHCGLGNKGEKVVLLEMEVPDAEILVSDYDLWHNVLNNGHIFKSAAERLAFERKYKDSNEETRREQEYAKRASWDRIFDMDYHSKYSAYPKHLKRLQGVTWGLRPEWLISHRFFTAR